MPPRPPPGRRIDAARAPRAAALALFFLSIFPSPSRASAPEMLGLGARSGALAATGAADAAGWESAYLNPAGLTAQRSRRLTLGYMLGRYRLQRDGAGDNISDTNGVLLGAALPLRLGGVMADRLALGLAFYTPAGVINRAATPYPDAPRLALLYNRTQVVSVIVSGGLRLHDRVSVGGGVIALASLVGEIRISPDAGGRIGTVSEQQLVVDYAPIVGARVTAARPLIIGATFRGESRSEHDIAITNRLGPRLPLEIPTLRITGVSQFDPMQVSLEAAYRLNHRVLVIAGATWKRWSAFPQPSENATRGAPPQPPPGYHDTVVPRAAVEIGAISRPSISLEMRAGYFFEWSPAPAALPEHTLLDADRHVVTGGAGFTWRGPSGAVVIDACAQWHQLAGSPRAGGGFFIFGVTAGVDL